MSVLRFIYTHKKRAKNANDSIVDVDELYFPWLQHVGEFTFIAAMSKKPIQGPPNYIVNLVINNSISNWYDKNNNI